MAQVLADPVEDHDGVVHREADHGQHSGHEKAVDLPDAPSQHSPHDREEPCEQEDVVQKGSKGRTAELKACPPSTRYVSETDRQQQQDRDRCEHDREHGELDGLLGDRPTHHLHLLDVHRSDARDEVVLDVHRLGRR